MSLNPHTPPEPGLVHKTLRYRHPQFSPRAEGGQRLLDSIVGKRGLWFCGAWRGYGFHEVLYRVRMYLCMGACSLHAGFQHHRPRLVEANCMLFVFLSHFETRT